MSRRAADSAAGSNRPPRYVAGNPDRWVVFPVLCPESMRWMRVRAAASGCARMMHYRRENDSAPGHRGVIRSRPLAREFDRSAQCLPEDEDGSRSTVPCFAIRAGQPSRSLYARPSGPEIAEAEGDRIERADADRLVVLRARNQEPLPVVQLERLKRAIRRVDEPEVPDSFAGIDRALFM